MAGGIEQLVVAGMVNIKLLAMGSDLSTSSKEDSVGSETEAC
jgi:hypothetical protein